MDFSGFRHPFHRIASRLGRAKDGVLGAEIGADRRLVMRVRHLFRIPRFDPLREFENALGDVPDWRIARAAGVSLKTVRRRRYRLGVPPYEPLR